MKTQQLPCRTRAVERKAKADLIPFFSSLLNHSFRKIFISLILGTCFCTAPAYADRINAVLFTGFSGTSGHGGMDILRLELINELGANAAVFSHLQGRAALNFVEDNQESSCCLVLIGHSFGGDAVIEFANNYLNPSGIQVDLSVQIDSVGLFDDVLPGNVREGLNYFQIPTSFNEPGGEQNVQGAANFNAETLFNINPNALTHTNIDSYIDLRELIAGKVAEVCVGAPEPGTLTLTGILALLGYAWRRQKRWGSSVDGA